MFGGIARVGKRVPSEKSLPALVAKREHGFNEGVAKFGIAGMNRAFELSSREVKDLELAGGSLGGGFFTRKADLVPFVIDIFVNILFIMKYASCPALNKRKTENKILKIKSKKNDQGKKMAKKYHEKI